jgi:hypothetical protein
MMTKKKILEVIMTIEHAYNNPFTRNLGNFGENETKEQKLVKIVDTWFKLLKDYDPEKIQEHLDHHIMTSKYPPSIAELINQPEKEIPSGPVVPTAEETQEMLRERARNRRNAASPEVREKHLAEIRRILNIPDDKENHHDRATS